MFNPTHVYIDLEALSNNLRQIKTIAPMSKILAMVKCNAYGHGAIEIATRIDREVGAFGVMFLKEALPLKHAGIQQPIVILTGFFDSDELKIIDTAGFECVIHNFEQIEILEKSHLSQPLAVWLKIDTGMHRLGFQPEQVMRAYQHLMLHPMVRKPLRLVTHFSDADDLVRSKTKEQLACFERLVSGLAGEWCVANSAALLNWPQTHLAWVRPGILLYGASPVNDRTALDLGLKPVMTLASHIITIHELSAGETIGYGSTFRCPHNMRIGTVATGYGDGYPRNTHGAPVVVEGVQTRVVGRVAMDMLGVDLSQIPQAQVGSKVVLWGRGVPVEEVSKCSGEISYELFCRLTSRVKYEFYQHSLELTL